MSRSITEPGGSRDPVEPSTDATKPLPSRATPGGTGGPDAFSNRDPRRDSGLSPRDFVNLAFIGQMGVVAQYQLHLTLGKVSEVVASRCAKRLARYRFISVLRWNKTGINLLKLTAAGRDALLAHGTREQDVFLGKWPAPSSLSHTLWIVDTVLAIRDLPGAWDVVPCWSLRRRFAGTTSPVPDLLAVSGDGRRLLVIEIDLGGENLRRVFIPKLETLTSAVSDWSRGASAAILVLTVGERRCESLAARAKEAGLPVVAMTLPAAIGRPAPAALAALIRRSGKE